MHQNPYTHADANMTKTLTLFSLLISQLDSTRHLVPLRLLVSRLFVSLISLVRGLFESIGSLGLVIALLLLLLLLLLLILAELLRRRGWRVIRPACVS
jgi:hypothetical protein